MADRRVGGGTLRAVPAEGTPRWLSELLDAPERSPLPWLDGRAVAAATAVIVGLAVAHVATENPAFGVAFVAGTGALAAAVAVLVVRLRRSAGFTAALLRGLEEQGEGVVVSDPAAARVLWVNDATARMTGRSRAEMLGTPATDQLVGDDRALVAERLRMRAAGHAVPPRARYAAQRADGSTFRADAVSVPIDVNGRRLLISLTRDTTRLDEIEDRARADQAFAAAVLQTVASAVAVTDPDGRLVLVNPTLERLAGEPGDDLLGRRWLDLGQLDALAEGEAEAAFERVLAGAPRVSVTTPWCGADGTRRELEWTLTPVSQHGDVRYVVGSGSDVTARRAVEGRLRGALGQLEIRTGELERLNAELEQFAAIASHDLREPLRAITGFAELLRRHAGAGLDERSTHYLELIGQASVRMDALLDALSRYGRAGRAEAPAGPVDLAGSLDNVLQSLAAQIAERGAEITAEELPTVTADPVAVEQVLQNLIANAIKFNTSAPPRVHVEAVQRGPAWELTVRDNGIGIPERERERVFEMFRRLHPRDAYPGTGAGLAIVQRIVERNGGRVWVDEAPGGGSEFHVVLPREGAQP